MTKEKELVVDLTSREEYFVTDKHPFCKELGIGKIVKLSAHTHGQNFLQKGWVSKSPIKAKMDK